MLPEIFYINNTKLVNDLKKNGELRKLDTEYSLDVWPSRSIKNVHIKYSFKNIDGVALKPIDFLIIDAVYTIYQRNECDNVFSIRQLNRILTGETDSKKAISKERLALLSERVKSLMNINITIDYKAEAKARQKEYIPIEDVPLLCLKEKTSAKKKGSDEEINAKYLITAAPPFYIYSEVNKQVLNIPSNRFYCISKEEKGSPKKKITNTMRNLLIKYYLIHELEIIRSTSKKGVYKYNEIPFFAKKGAASTECDKGLLTQLHSKTCEKERVIRTPNIQYWFEEPDEAFFKCKSIIGRFICDPSARNSPSLRHIISDIEATVSKILEFYKSDGYLEKSKIIKDEKGIPKITNIAFVEDLEKSENKDAASDKAVTDNGETIDVEADNSEINDLLKNNEELRLTSVNDNTGDED